MDDDNGIWAKQAGIFKRFLKKELNFGVCDKSTAHTYCVKASTML